MEKVAPLHLKAISRPVYSALKINEANKLIIDAKGIKLALLSGKFRPMLAPREEVMHSGRYFCNTC